MKIVVGILIFGIIVLIHEFGHFIFARLNGIEVLDFSIGMGPRLCGFKAFGTKFSVRLFPIGGACMMLGEDTDQNTVSDKSFFSKSVWQRIAVLFAGPFFNFILAFIFSIIVISFAGFDPARIVEVTENGAAAEAGLQPGDIITKINGSHISVAREVESYFNFRKVSEEPIQLTIKRDGKKQKITLLSKSFDRYMLGFTYSENDVGRSEIIAVSAGGPMDKAGVKVKDVIKSINGVPIQSSTDLMKYLEENPFSDQPVTMVLSREGNDFSVSPTPLFSFVDYSLGFYYNMAREKATFLETIRYSASEVKYWIVETGRGLVKLVTGKIKSQEIGSAVAIFDAIGKTYEASIEYGVKDTILNMLYITILLSANIGVMNLLPIPALDGGKLLFCFIEVIRRKPIDHEKEGMVHLIGMVLLMLLMVVLVFNDIRNIFFH